MGIRVDIFMQVILIIFLLILLYSIAKHLYKIILGYGFKNKKRIEASNIYSIAMLIVAFIYMLLFLFGDSSTVNLTMFFNAIIFISLSMLRYEYNFILSQGLFIKGKTIPWNKIKKWDYKGDSYNKIEIEYFRDEKRESVDHVIFRVDDDFKMELVDILKKSIDNRTLSDISTEIYIDKKVKLKVSMVLLALIVTVAFGIYKFMQPKSMPDMVGKEFKDRKISTLTIWYDSKDTNVIYGNMARGMTTKKDKIQEVVNYLSEIQLTRKFSRESIYYNFEDVYRIELYELSGDKLEIYIHKSKPIVEVSYNDYRRKVYSIANAPLDFEVLNKLGESINSRNKE